MRHAHWSAWLMATVATIGQADAPEATPAGDAPTKTEVATLDTIYVIGSREAQQKLVGAGTYLDRNDITTQSYEDIHRVLRQIPGVYVREEDGFGLFPNISLRGVDPGRSAKLTLMEDGILAAPAPYSDPAAYYSPNIARMAGLEVLKGSSQVRHGPHSTGGVINYLSTSIPQAREGYARISYGSDNDLRTHGWFGETVALGQGRFGYVVESYFRETGGFKEIDGPATDVGPGSDDSGFRRSEPMIKLAWDPGTATFQRIEFKYGVSRLDADETYLGLSEDDFKANPLRRYAASRFDSIATEHDQLYLRHFLRLDGGSELVTTAYRSDFHRNWFKINAVNGNSLSHALAGANDGADLATLRGEAAGTLNYRNNNRTYYLKGADTALTLPFATGDIGHHLRVGLRWHEDQIFRFQHDEAFTQNEQGGITGHTINAPGSQDNRRAQTRALALYLEDRIGLGRLDLLPGIRVEQLDWQFDNYRSAVSRDGDRTLVAGGIGANWQLIDELGLFGSIYRGFSPPNPEAATAPGNEAREETSLSVELGARYAPSAALSAELTLFRTGFENLVVSGNLGASGTADGGAVGEVDSYGAELALRYDPALAAGHGFRTPLVLALTYTHAEIGNDSNSTNAESIFNGGRKGNRLPYVPDWQLHTSAGLHYGAWALDLTAFYADEAFATALNTDALVIQGAGGPVADARGGTIDALFVIDLSASWQLNPALKLLVSGHNLLDDASVASRLPEGPRPGTPRTVLVGVELRTF